MQFLKFGSFFSLKGVLAMFRTLSWREEEWWVLATPQSGVARTQATRMPLTQATQEKDENLCIY
jgi:hypothetical protein